VKRTAGRRTLAVILLVLASTACTKSGAASPGSQLGLKINVPSGWHVRSFTEPLHGVEIANVPLPRLVQSNGAPLQATGIAFPSRGVALVVFEGTWRGYRSKPLPLAELDMVKGSCLGGAPCLELAAFTANGHSYFVTAKVGSNAWGADYNLLTKTIHSIAPS
jgi:hypothetical protein